MAMSSPSSSPSSPSRQKSRQRPPFNVLTKPSGLTKSNGATAKQWGHFVPPRLPRCSQTGLPKRLEIWKKEARVVRHQNKVEEFEHHNLMGTGGDVDGLRAILRHKHGSAARGWRVEIAQSTDKEGHDYAQVGAKPVSFGELCRGLKRVGFGGNVLSLWKNLSRGADHIGLEDLEPRLGEQLDAVARGVVEQYEDGCQQAFDDIDRDHNARMTADEFERWLVEREIVAPDEPRVNPRLVFETLAISGRGTVTCEELRFLDYWAFHRLGVPVPVPATKVQYQDVPWTPPPEEKKTVHGLEEFREHLEQRYGSAARAWRTVLDVKNVGSLTSGEFGMACRQAGWKHPHHPVWEEARQLGYGGVNLRALDPKSAKALDKLKELGISNFGNLWVFWSQLLDPDGDGTVSRTEFLDSVCGELEMSKAEAARAFAALDSAGTGWLSTSEIGFLGVMEGSRAQERSTQSLGSSLSAGALPLAGRSRHGISSDGSWGQADTSFGSSWEAGSTRSPKKLTLWSPAKSTRAMQNRTYANAHYVKSSWLKGAVLDRSYSSTSVHSNFHRSLSSQEEGLYRKSSQHADVFRCTNEFYREGMRRIAENHELTRQTSGSSAGGY